MNSSSACAPTSLDRTDPAPVVAASEEGAGRRRLVVDVSGHLLERTLSAPGQYVMLGVDRSETRPFVVASRAADLPRAEFVIAAGTDVSVALATGPVPRLVYLTGARGTGFAMDRLRGRPVVFFTAGTGLAGVRPVIDELLSSDPPSRSPLALFHSDSRPGTGVLEEERHEWRALGVEVHSLAPEEGLPRPTLEEEFQRGEGAAARLAGAVFVLCGSPRMVAGVETMLRDRGVSGDRVHRNW